ncbi:hypothetical protein F966_01281 [Acinetobacter higginsii]|uniref:Uncharacterized protein n=1 Tax=Acinetobacter higginsii TaxID=70347 RepID=N8XM51_9GAMM|nr:hypothetical protein [Acinetobacter higginsii]ENV10109.1 hypothetical protein F966_01281 [Acinetobacter higginsii]
MKGIIKLTIASAILLNSMGLYAESTNQCTKYWNETAVKVKVLEDIECPDIWEDGLNKENKKLAKEIGFNLKDKNWMSTGTCNHVLYKNTDYYIYWAYMKHNRTDLIMIYNPNNSFAYSREIDRTKLKKEGFRVEDSVDVNLSCAKSGNDTNIVSVLNGYLFQETSIQNILKYRVYDRFKQ